MKEEMLENFVMSPMRRAAAALWMALNLEACICWRETNVDRITTIDLGADDQSQNQSRDSMQQRRKWLTNGTELTQVVEIRARDTADMIR